MSQRTSALTVFLIAVLGAASVAQETESKLGAVTPGADDPPQVFGPGLDGAFPEGGMAPVATGSPLDALWSSPRGTCPCLPEPSTRRAPPRVHLRRGPMASATS